MSLSEITNFKIEKLSAEFTEQIEALEKECLGKEAWTADGVKETMLLNGHYFGAFIGTKLIGHMGLTVVLDEGYVTNIAVASDFRRKGIASALLETVIMFAKENKLSFITLEVRQSNEAAIKLYEKFGFVAVGKRKRFYSCPFEDAIIMTLDF